MESRTTADQWARVHAVFDEAMQRPAGERARFLEDACAGDSALRLEVESLLQANERANDFLEAPVFEAVPQLLETFSEESMEGRTIGSYIVRQEIGRGGMGVVYLADDTRLSRRVALKAFAPDLGPTGRQRLRREARAAAGLSYPGIATVYALEDIEGELYMVSEYVPGPTLRAVVRSGPVPAAQVLDMATQLARALAAAHAQGVVHQDLKPENLVRTAAGVIKVLDFGIARAENLTPPTASEGAASPGTPGYMAPEQIHGAAVDFRADLFSFGAVIFELATGVHPFASGSDAATTRRILEDEPASLAGILPTGYEGLQAIVEKCLRKDAAERYESTYRLVVELERLQQDVSLESALAESGRTRRETPGSATRPGPSGWWDFHQGAVSTIYALIIYPAWLARPWLAPWGTVFLLILLTCATAAATLRLHLVFVRHFHDPLELLAQRTRAQPWIRWCDTGLAASLLLAAIRIADANSVLAIVFVTVAIAAALASFVIEPATARAVFGASPK